MEQDVQEPICRGRRSRSRLRTTLRAQFTTFAGTFSCVLLDVSLSGAKVVISDRRGITEQLKVGQSGIVEWGSFDAFGTIAWVSGDVCGLCFSDFLPQDDLLATRNIQDELAERGGLKYLRSMEVKDWVSGHGR